MGKTIVLCLGFLLLCGLPVLAQDSQPASVEEQIGLLQSEDAAVRLRAVQTLGQVKGEDELVVAALVDALGDEESDVAQAAQDALVTFGSSGVPFLLPLLVGEDYSLSHSARTILTGIGKPAVPLLATALAEDNTELRDSLYGILGEIGVDAVEAAPALVRLLADASGQYSSPVQTLIKIGAGAIPAVREGLAAPETNVRLWSSVTLLSLAPQDETTGNVVVDTLVSLGEEALPCLIETVSQADEPGEEDVAYQACIKRVIARLGDKAISASLDAFNNEGGGGLRCDMLRQALLARQEAVLQLLTSRLQDDDEDTRRNACSALVRLGDEAVPMVLKKLPETPVAARFQMALAVMDMSASDDKVRGLVAQTLARSLPLEQGGPRLLALLQSSRASAAARSAVAEAVVLLGDPLVPDLARLLEKEDTYGQSLVAECLARIGKSSVPHVLRILRGRNYLAHHWAKEIVKKLPDDAIPAFIVALTDGSQDVREAAEQFLAGKPEAMVNNVALSLLADADAKVQTAALAALGQWATRPQSAESVATAVATAWKNSSGPAHAQLGKLLVQSRDKALPHLAVMFQQSDAAVRLEIIGLWRQIGGKALPSLLQALADGDAGIRQQAAWAVIEMGDREQVAMALPVVLEMLTADDLATRKRAAFILPRIQPDKAAAALPVFVECLRAPDSESRCEAADIIGKLGEPALAAVPDLSALLQDKMAEVRCKAAVALANIQGENATAAIPVLLESLTSRRYGSVAVLKALEKTGDKAIPQLLGMCEKAESAMRDIVLQTVFSQGEKAIPHLVQALQTNNASLRYRLREFLQKQGDKTIPHLVAAMKGGNEEACRNALSILEDLREQAVPALREMLQESDVQLQYQAAFALVRIEGKQAKETLPLLLRAFQQQEDEKLMTQAVRYLTELTENQDDVVPTMVKSLQDSYWKRRLMAAGTLAHMGERGAGVLQEYLASPDRQLQRICAIMLRGVRREKAPETIPWIVEALQDPVPEITYLAALALTTVDGDEASLAVPFLIKALKDKDSSLKVGAAAGLKQLGKRATPALPALIEALQEQSYPVSQTAAAAIERLVELDPQSLPLLLQALQSPQVNVKNSVLAIIKKLGVQAKQAAPALIAIVQDQQPCFTANDRGGFDITDRDAYYLRMKAIEMLGNMQDNLATPVLLAIVSDARQETYMRSEAIKALASLGDETAIPAIIERLGDYNTTIQWKAVESLEKMGDKALPALIEVVQGKQWIEIKMRVAMVMEKLGPRAVSALPVLLAVLEQQTSQRLLHDKRQVSLREQIHKVLGAIGDERALPILLADRQNSDWHLSFQAGQALEKFGEKAVPALLEALPKCDAKRQGNLLITLGGLKDKAEAAVPAVIGLLKADHPGVRRLAAETLGNIGNKANTVKTALTEALQDQDASVRQASQAALEKIK